MLFQPNLQVRKFHEEHTRLCCEVMFSRLSGFGAGNLDLLPVTSLTLNKPFRRVIYQHLLWYCAIGYGTTRYQRLAPNGATFS